jgi:hypothetical protein
VAFQQPAHLLLEVTFQIHQFGPDGQHGADLAAFHAFILASRYQPTVDTTVQPKAVMHPTDAKLMLRAIEKLGAQAKSHRLKLRQSYARLANRAALMAGRYTHAKQFKRANRMLKFLRKARPADP